MNTEYSWPGIDLVTVMHGPIKLYDKGPVVSFQTKREERRNKGSRSYPTSIVRSCCHLPFWRAQSTDPFLLGDPGACGRSCQGRSAGRLGLGLDFVS